MVNTSAGFTCTLLYETRRCQPTTVITPIIAKSNRTGTDQRRLLTSRRSGQTSVPASLHWYQSRSLDWQQSQPLRSLSLETFWHPRRTQDTANHLVTPAHAIRHWHQCCAGPVYVVARSSGMRKAQRIRASGCMHVVASGVMPSHAPRFAWVQISRQHLEFGPRVDGVF